MKLAHQHQHIHPYYILSPTVLQHPPPHTHPQTPVYSHVQCSVAHHILHITACEVQLGQHLAVTLMPQGSQDGGPVCLTGRPLIITASIKLHLATCASNLCNKREGKRAHISLEESIQKAEDARSKGPPPYVLLCC